ncbi:MAG: hydrogenase maturation nickel metallochaperone HypA [Spirochaetes bacterium]|nr:hydrogenase maturation nickel metallochaperone HypA [Spirochaetota bacterium]
MHELSIMSSILDIILEYARNNNAKRITGVNLRIGVLSDVIPDWAQNYFDMLSKDTVADGAKLNIERVEARVKCRECGHEQVFDRDTWKFYCEKCQSGNMELLSGRELTVSSIEIE